MDTGELVRVLRTVPAFRLRLIDLAWKVGGTDGKPDQEILLFYGLALKEATAEAEDYSRATKDAVQWLIQLGRF